MDNPFFWLGISILLVAISLMALLTVAILTLQELARAARSAEKLLDTLNKEIPPTLNDLRLTGKELSGLSDEVSGSVQSARSVVEQVDKGITEAKVHAYKAQVTTRSFFAGATAAFKVLAGQPRRRRRPPTRRPPIQPTAAPSPNPVLPSPSSSSTVPASPNTKPSSTEPSSTEPSGTKTSGIKPSNTSPEPQNTP
ncbi:MAG: DUF948 domain-containing protein [Cyanobacteria bacterium J06649_4]